ncbi:MAG TPA: rubrerythrin family protein [Bacteroidota bacterium]|nr:rubrerythrin family protein [Bacteroidota bacterium]
MNLCLDLCLSKPTKFPFTPLQLIFFLLTVFSVSIVLPGCGKKETPQAAPEITLQNLETAYSRESRISREYAVFSANAEKKHYSAVANLFKAVSRSEEIHAGMAATLLRSKGVEVKPFVPESVAVGTVVQSLRLASSDESLETESMYPNLIHAAEVEKFPEAAESFQLALNADKRHAELFKAMLDKNASGIRIQYYVCPECGYIITSDTARECPGCHTKKEKFEKI